MKCASVCSGIGAPEVAWTALGWKFAFAAEIEKFPSAVLAHRFLEVPNYGDMTKHETWKPEPAGIDVLVGGTPCQSFSVAGLRAGLADPRGNLTLVFLSVVAQYRPRWVVWENVPGVLSDATGGFAALLGGLAELGYGFAYRVLDAQYFGVAQRRRRVFVVARAGGQWQRAAAVLFERESLRGDPAPGRDAGQGLAPTISARTEGGGGLGTDFDCDGGVIPILEAGKRQGLRNSPRDGLGVGAAGDSMFTLQAGAQHAVALACNTSSQRMAPTLQTVIPFDVSQIASKTNRTRAEADLPNSTLCGGGAHVAFQPRYFTRDNKTGGAESCGEQIAALSADHGGGDSAPHVAFASEDGLYQWAPGGGNDLKNTAQALRAGAEHSYQFIKGGACVRRLTPKECERLMGFPDDFTAIPWKGKPASECPDGPRYKALGNSMAVPVLKWIGRRIQLVDTL